jgi:hypothetical protein
VCGLQDLRVKESRTTRNNKNKKTGNYKLDSDDSIVDVELFLVTNNQISRIVTNIDFRVLCT